MFGFPMSTFIILFVLPVGLFLLALDDVVRRQFSDSGTKVVWALVVLLVPILGPLLYLAVGKKQGERKGVVSHGGNAQIGARDEETGSVKPGARVTEAERADSGGAAFATRDEQKGNSSAAGVRLLCPSCRAVLTIDRPTCPKCSVAIRFCPTCQVPVVPTRPVCPKCGDRMRFSRPT